MTSLELYRSILPTITTCLAIYGIIKWRSEAVGKRRLELAEELLASFYEIKDLISTIRNPLSFEAEDKSEPNEDSVYSNAEEKRIQEMANILINRYQKYEERFNRFYALRYRVMATFGKEMGKPIELCMKQIKRILNANRRLYTNQMFEIRYRGRDSYLLSVEEIQQLEAIIWEGYHDGADQVIQELEIIESQLENLCKHEASFLSRLLSRIFD